MGVVRDVQVLQDRNVAIARVEGLAFVGDRTMAVAGTGSSRRHPGDPEDRALGAAIALARAYRSFGARSERLINGVLKHQEDVKNMRHKTLEEWLEESMEVNDGSRD